jgi:L-fuconolactonase
MLERDDWLKPFSEAVIEPDLPIIDPHHHLWDRLGGTRYLLDELLLDTTGHNVRQTVFVECNSMYRADATEPLKCVGETEFVRGIAAQSNHGQYGDMRVGTGIVGAANLLLGAGVQEVLEAHLAASPATFRGIRYKTAWAASVGLVPGGAKQEGLMNTREFVEGFSMLGRYNLSFDAWLLHPQLEELAELAGKFPDTTIILNHLGGPIGTGPYAKDRSQVFDDWKRGLSSVAAHENVVLKVGGIQMPINGFGWHERATPPTSDELVNANGDWYLTAIDLFGPDRCMFESNFPVERQSCSYTALWNQIKKLSGSFSSTERAAMMHDTAMRVYRLDAV